MKAVYYSYPTVNFKHSTKWNGDNEIEVEWIEKDEFGSIVITERSNNNDVIEIYSTLLFLDLNIDVL